MSPKVRDGCCPRRCQELAAAGRQEKPGAARRQEQEGNNGYKEAGAARRQKQKWGRMRMEAGAGWKPTTEKRVH